MFKWLADWHNRRWSADLLGQARDAAARMKQCKYRVVGWQHEAAGYSTPILFVERCGIVFAWSPVQTVTGDGLAMKWGMSFPPRHSVLWAAKKVNPNLKTAAIDRSLREWDERDFEGKRVKVRDACLITALEGAHDFPDAEIMGGSFIYNGRMWQHAWIVQDGGAVWRMSHDGRKFAEVAKSLGLHRASEFWWNMCFSVRPHCIKAEIYERPVRFRPTDETISTWEGAR